MSQPSGPQSTHPGIKPMSQVYNTTLYPITLPNSLRSELLISTDFTQRDLVDIDYTTSTALEEVFKTLPLPSSKFLDQLAPSIAVPAAALAAGETISFPTETVYGLGANARDTHAVEQIYAAKGRPSDNPLIVHIATLPQLESLVPSPISPLATALIHNFWPGPLSIILPHKSSVSQKVTAGLSTLAIRMPNHPIALGLISLSDCPVAAPSSNLSGKPSPTTAQHVMTDLKGRIPGVVDGFVTLVPDVGGNDGAGNENGAEIIDLNCSFGLESTVIDISHLPSNFDFKGMFERVRAERTLDGESEMGELQGKNEPKQPLIFILRPGAVTKAMLEKVVGVGYVEYDPSLLINMESFDEIEQEQELKLDQTLSELNSFNEKILSGNVQNGQNVQNAQNSTLPQSGHSPSGNLTLQTTSTSTSISAGSGPKHIHYDTKNHGLQPKSPGMKYTHYAPRAPVYIATNVQVLQDSLVEALRKMGTEEGPRVGVGVGEGDNQLDLQNTQNGQNVQDTQNKIGLLCTTETSERIMATISQLAANDPSRGIDLDRIVIKTCGSKDNMWSIATKLYGCLRDFDQVDSVKVIFAEIYSHNELGAAIMDRLLKAAGGKLLR